MKSHSMLKDIPGPPALPILGNLLDVRDEVPIKALGNIADKYGPIYKLSLRGKEIYFVSNCKLVGELCDETRFLKVAPDGLTRNKLPGPTGLFSAKESDPDWGQAHRTLMPAFGPLSIGEMFDEMHDIATQLVLKWARKGPENRIPVTDDFTRLTLDTIALCAMGYRFNSFYQDDMHPFVKAMTNSLAAGNGPSTLWDVFKAIKGGTSQTVLDDKKLMHDVAADLVKFRRDNPIEKKDLLNAMINGKDPRTGEGMRDELISANMITFLVAGHETTSGLLSFAFMQLLKNPAAYRAAKNEVDRVVGKNKIRLEHMKDLKYLSAVLRETLRLSPTVPAFVRQVRDENKEDPPSVGGYEIKRDSKIIALISKAQQDPEVYGEDAKEFKPERMLDEQFEKLPKSAWKPFGTGMRACIGRPFAWQEALLATALILQVFDLKLDNPSYEPRVKQTLTIKPRDFYMRATLREGMDPTNLQEHLISDGHNQENNLAYAGKQGDEPSYGEDVNEMLVLFGSNTGTCETLAQKLASDAGRFGYVAKVGDLDSAIHTLPGDQPVVIIIASYGGQPPDNAAHFYNWLISSDERSGFEAMDYAVFGCGHSDWSATFQRIPTLIDDILEMRQAKRLVPRGFADAAKGDIFSDFDQWADQVFWPVMAKRRGTSPTNRIIDRSTKLEIDVSRGDRAFRLRQDVHPAIVQSTRCLVSSGEPEKRHMEILLPSDMAYEPGDYLTILPLNPDSNIRRAMNRYRIPRDANIVINTKGPTTLPTNASMSVFDLLKGYVELSQPATKKDLDRLLESSPDEEAITVDLKALSGDVFVSEVINKRMSVLDLLERYESIALPFNIFLAMLPPMRLRHYSISSSPLADPSRCTITYSVIDEGSLSGQGQFVGVAGSYLKSLKPGDTLQVAVRGTNKQFRLPLQIERTPVLMICAGTGLAPFRGFVQQRAEQIKAIQSRRLAPAVLFIGCRSSSHDRLYAEELDAWEKEGAVDIKYAFSEQPHHTLAKGCEHVQDRMIKEKNDVFELWDQGAKVFICGSSGMAHAVGQAAKELITERVKALGGADVDEEELKKWFLEHRNERFVTDVFA